MTIFVDASTHDSYSVLSLYVLETKKHSTSVIKEKIDSNVAEAMALKRAIHHCDTKQYNDVVILMDNKIVVNCVKHEIPKRINRVLREQLESIRECCPYRITHISRKVNLAHRYARMRSAQEKQRLVEVTKCQ